MQANVLIVEDDYDIREALRELLEAEGYQTASASTGREALDLLEKIPRPALVLLDLMMPVMNGHQFLEAARADPRLKDLPVVVITAQPSGAHAADAVIRKPFTAEGLLSLVARHARPGAEGCQAACAGERA